MNATLAARKAALFARTTDLTLVESMLALDGRDLTQEERMVRAWTIDEVCRRFPAVDEALEEWSMSDDETESMVVCAARVALEVLEAAKVGA